MSYYFNGGIYPHSLPHSQNEEFKAVRPTRGLPYVTLRSSGVSCDSSPVYRLSDDLKQAYCVRERGNGVICPMTVDVPAKLQEEFKQSIERFEKNRAEHPTIYK